MLRCSELIAPFCLCCAVLCCAVLCCGVVWCGVLRGVKG